MTCDADGTMDITSDHLDVNTGHQGEDEGDFGDEPTKRGEGFGSPAGRGT